MLETPSGWSIIAEEALYTIDSKQKIRRFVITLSHDANEDKCTIFRVTGLLDGKTTDQPLITIKEGKGIGKGKRTVLQQGQLEFDSIVKKQRDKGYKSLSDLKIKTTVELQSALGPTKTTTDGFKPPMLALDFDKVKDKTKVLSRGWYISLKLDGVRTTANLVKDENGNDKLIFVSRGGLPYKGVARNFEYDQDLIMIARTKNCQIDGEFYIHGMPLKDINGTCQLDEYDPVRHDPMQFWIFDLGDEVSTFEERNTALKSYVKPLLQERGNIKVLDHTYVTTPEEVEDFHNDAVKRGFEGGIIRAPKAKYQHGKKNSNMYKIKKFQDEEFKVIGYKEGLRPIEDMVFVLETKDGKTFEAKPQGDLKTKTEYVTNMPTLIGKYGTVKFFYYTPDGIPYLPSFKSFRPMKDGNVLI